VKSEKSASRPLSIRLDCPYCYNPLYNDLEAFALAQDGLNPLPPSYCCLKPYYLDPNRSYFEQLARGES